MPQERERARAKTAGIVDQEVQATVPLDGRQQFSAVQGVGHVAAQCSDRTGWHRAGQLVEQIRALTALRDGLDSCIGCGCLSLRTCGIQNPADVAAGQASGAAYLPSSLRRVVRP